jgi:hypothetical protein
MQKFLPFRDASRLWVRQILSAWCILLLVCTPLLCPAQSTPGLAPSDVEAAYLYNFGKFVRWPAAQAQDSGPFAICILGDDGFGDTLNSLISNETLRGRKVVARRLPSPAAAVDCQIVFLGQSEETRLAKDLTALQKKPILTVSSLPGFLEHGGVIQFLLQNKRVRFAVNLAAAEPTGLALSSELLKVALYVNTNSTPEAKK